jgi:glycosyltransferase involved in cell wall biosynthesis
VRDGETVLLAETPSEFAGRIVFLFKDHAARAGIARRARALVETRYRWAEIGAKLLKVYEELEA